MPDHRQKKLAKHKKKRAAVRRTMSAAPQPTKAEIEALQTEILAAAAEWPLVGAWIPIDWNDETASREFPVILARSPEAGLLVMSVFLIDLGCLGLRDAFVTRPMEAKHRDAFVQQLADSVGRSFGSVQPEMAAALVRTATQEAEKLGFEQATDMARYLTFLPAAVPVEVEIAFGRNGKPYYEALPNEDTTEIVQTLVKAVGPDGFHIELLTHDHETCSDPTHDHSHG